MLDPEDVMAVLSSPPNDLPAGRQYAESGVVIFNFSVSARRRLLSHGRGGGEFVVGTMNGPEKSRQGRNSLYFYLQGARVP